MSDPKWESLRPWTPRLSLSVREVTSVSATFLLASLSRTTNLSQILDAQDDADAADSLAPHILPDSTAKGLSVTANGQAWPRVLARLDDAQDEAVVIVYGLLPGIQYDIEFAIVAGDVRLKSSVQTDAKPSAGLDPAHDLPEIVLSAPSPSAHALSSTRPHEPSPSPPSSSPPSTPGTHTPTVQAPSAFDDYLAELHTALSALEAEHDALSGTLKAARRDTQKLHAALKADLQALRKAGAKHAPADARMRQKIRALEEATKQAQRGRAEVDDERVTLEREHAAGHAARGDVGRAWERARDRAEEARAARERVEEDVGAQLAGARGELAQLEARLDKLRLRREKLEGSSNEQKEKEGTSEDGHAPEKRVRTVPELEARLAELQAERARVEDDPYAYVPPSASTASSSTHDTFARAQQLGLGLGHGHHAYMPMPAPNHTAPSGHAQSPPHRGKAAHRGFGAAQRGAFFASPSPPRAVAKARSGAGGGARPVVARRRSSPGAPGQGPGAGAGSTLSSLAVPFEPAGARGAGAWGS